MSPRSVAGRRPLANSPFNKVPADVPPPEVYAVDDQVTHDRYGLGRVLGVDGVTAVTVNFGTEIYRINIPSSKMSRI